jgi:hypothetical protein
VLALHIPHQGAKVLDQGSASYRCVWSTLATGNLANAHPKGREFRIVGSEEARLRAGLRPPPNLHVRFPRMQLSRRHFDLRCQNKATIKWALLTSVGLSPASRTLPFGEVVAGGWDYRVEAHSTKLTIGFHAQRNPANPDRRASMPANQPFCEDSFVTNKIPDSSQQPIAHSNQPHHGRSKGLIRRASSTKLRKFSMWYSQRVTKRRKLRIRRRVRANCDGHRHADRVYDSGPQPLKKRLRVLLFAGILDCSFSDSVRRET